MKKLLLIAAVVGVGFFALKGTRYFGLAKQEVSNLAEWVDSKIPAESEIKRLRKEISALDKDIKECGSALAKETVDLKYMKEDTDRLRTQISLDTERVQAKAEQIKDDVERVKLTSGRFVSKADAKESLKNDVDRIKNKKLSSEAMEKSIVAKEKVKEHLERQLDVMKKSKLTLASELDTIESELQLLKVQQMESKYQFDDTRLAKIKAGITDVRKKFDIAREELKLAPIVHEDKPAADTLTVDEILSGLGEDGKVSKK